MDSCIYHLIDHLPEGIYQVILLPPVSVHLGSGSWWMGCAIWLLEHKANLEVTDVKLHDVDRSAVHLKRISLTK